MITWAYITSVLSVWNRGLQEGGRLRLFLHEVDCQWTHSLRWGAASKKSILSAQWNAHISTALRRTTSIRTDSPVLTWTFSAYTRWKYKRTAAPYFSWGGRGCAFFRLRRRRLLNSNCKYLGDSLESGHLTGKVVQSETSVWLLIFLLHLCYMWDQRRH